ncbi:MAG: hypothetical protein VR67_12085 [Peptococcaceae bacterium BRH_c8a]|nr:MAG: hypothetical protein VR67_12085 [Peptococcaceae bacterium BRH_c8a]
MVVNYVEIAVKEIMEKLIEDYGYCKCEICKARALAMTLNDIEPQYVLTDAEFLAAKASFVRPDNYAKLLSITMDSLRKVNESINHDIQLMAMKNIAV